ncbi:hypothetical protein QJS10_CPB22g00111 [Acorus calamus]|uniref:FAR1 domain-containing protein n=1 Tax=Acorus calamus TaxID=4465 RepID=A0AAV9C1Z8_ACOCL|nr:hypothetical protein QJS10_CPB22g00111 [Acorus calamus]
MDMLVEDSVEDIEQIFEENGVWIPYVDENIKLVVGMCFDTLDEAESFYIRCARFGGFGVLKSSTRYRKGSKDIYRRELVCAKEGFKDTSQDKNEIRIRNRGYVRVGCKSRIRFFKEEDGK